jgi:hypothetical protein
VSQPRKLRPDEVWDAVMKMVDEDEAKRLQGMSEEEIDREARAEGLDPAADRARGEALAARLRRTSDKVPVSREAAVGTGRAGPAPGVSGRAVPSTRPKPARRVPYAVWAIAAVVGVLALVLLFERDEVMAWFNGEPARIEPDRPRPPEEPSAQERAKALRREAEITCQLELWVRCGQKLDEATKLDPAGESEPRVQALRAVVKEQTSRPKNDKPEKP